MQTHGCRSGKRPAATEACKAGFTKPGATSPWFVRRKNLARPEGPVSECSSRRCDGTLHPSETGLTGLQQRTGPPFLGLRPRLGETGLTGLNRRGEFACGFAELCKRMGAAPGNGLLRLRPEGPVSQSQGRQAPGLYAERIWQGLKGRFQDALRGVATAVCSPLKPALQALNNARATFPGAAPQAW